MAQKKYNGFQDHYECTYSMWPAGSFWCHYFNGGDCLKTAVCVVVIFGFSTTFVISFLAFGTLLPSSLRKKDKLCKYTSACIFTENSQCGTNQWTIQKLLNTKAL